MSDTTDTVDEAPRQHTLEELKEMVHELEGHDDPTTPSDEDDESYRIAVLLIAGLDRGVNLMDLIGFTGYHAEWVAKVADNLAKSGIWVDGITHCNWFDEDEDGISFWIDVNVGRGFLEKSSK